MPNDQLLAGRYQCAPYLCIGHEPQPRGAYRRVSGDWELEKWSSLVRTSILLGVRQMGLNHSRRSLKGGVIATKASSLAEHVVGVDDIYQ